jgi:hypothetical protein
VRSLVLHWERFNTFQEALKQFRLLPCLYLLIDTDDRILRIGESADLRARYRGGTGWMVEAALYRSGKTVFAAQAPPEERTRRSVEGWLTFRYQPQFCQRDKELPPLEEWQVEHTGDVPRALLTGPMEPPT